jgi:peptidoglycan/xylan/chitin deacetylase (PgdA/CDA1 family)
MWVITYHSISYGPPPLCIARDRFAAQLDRLLEAGWRAVPIEDALDDATDRPDRRFAVSFDDGYRDFADAALPILEERAIPATLFATAGNDRSALPGGIEGQDLLEPAQLRELADRGVELAGHGIAHVDLTRLDDAALADELRAGRERLSDWTGRAVRYLAYPFGAFDRRVITAAAREYAAAFTTQLAAIPPAHHPHAIPRVDACYLDGPALERATRRGDAARQLALRRWLRRLRGSEPRRAIPAATSERRATRGAARRTPGEDELTCP